MRNPNNTYKVYCYEAECNTFTNSYASGKGFAMGTSIKKAIAEAKAMMNKTLNGWTPIVGNLVVVRGGKIIYVESEMDSAVGTIMQVKRLIFGS